METWALRAWGALKQGRGRREGQKRTQEYWSEEKEGLGQHGGFMWPKAGTWLTKADSPIF